MENTGERNAASLELNDAVHYLIELMGSYDAEKLCYACSCFAKTLKKVDSDSLHLLLEKDVVGGIIKMMEALPSHSSAQQAGCDAILSCNELVELRSCLEDYKAFGQVLIAVKTHPDDVDLLGKAYHALASLAATAVYETPLKETKAYNIILLGIHRFCDNIEVQSGGLWALSSLLEMDPFAASNVALQGHYNIVLNSIRSHSTKPGIVTHGFQCLRSIIKCNNNNSEVFPEISKNLEYVLNLLNDYMQDEDVAVAALGLIEALAELKKKCLTSFSGIKDYFKVCLKNFNLLEIVFQLIKQFPELANAQIYGFNTLDHIFSFCEVKASDELLDNWLNLLDIVMRHHNENNEVNESCCNFLSQLLLLYPHIHCKIGDSDEQIPLHNYIWMILLNLSYRPNSTLFVAVSNALYHLIECDGKLQQIMLKKGASVALLECLREYLGDLNREDKCVEYGCRALRGILMHLCSDDQKQYLLDVGLFAHIQEILNTFSNNADVIIEIFCVIACVSDTAYFQKQVIAHSLYKAILENIEKYVSNEILVEPQAIHVPRHIMLILPAEMIQYFNEMDMLGITASSMKKHVTFPSIQFKGCMLIRLLCDSNYFVMESLCTSVANVVIDALSRKSDNKVRSEALACAQVLSKCTEQMAMALVRGALHILLFTLLYRDVTESHESNVGKCAQLEIFSEASTEVDSSNSKVEDFFFRVGTDIIYTLSCVWNFQQEMLVTTIRDGLLEGVNVMVEIGADVNAESNGEIPICIAVKSNNKRMVECLLKHGITNVNVHAALKISWELNFDEITGILLKNIAVDRNRDLVNLSGLDLSIIKPLWILPSLGVTDLSPARHQRHQRQKSLGHVKDFLVRRKTSIDIPIKPDSEMMVHKDITARRKSVDISALMFISDKQHDVKYESEQAAKHCEEYTHADKKDELSNDSGVVTIDNGTVIRPHNQKNISRGSVRRNMRSRTISGATTLPSSQLDQYNAEDTAKDFFSSTHNHSSIQVSPSHLFRQLRKRHKRGSKEFHESSSSNFSVRADSPMYYEYTNTSIGNFSSTMDESTFINATIHDSQIVTSDSSFMSLHKSRSEYEQVDFGGCDTIPEEPVMKEQKHSQLVKMLDISSNQLCNFNSLCDTPSEGAAVFGQLRDVLRLDLKQNNLSEMLEDMMKAMKKLVAINLSCNNFSEFPMDAVTSSKLTEVDISSNKLTIVPSLPVMGNLLNLNLSHNQLAELPECIDKRTGKSSFPHLRYLDLRSNQITTVPDLSCCPLKDLEMLNISRNRIQKLPDDFLTGLPSLRILDASMNEIADIGGVVGEDMVHLEEVRLACNCLFNSEAFFNNFITSAPVLQVVDASENGLTSVPPPYAWKSLGVREIRYTKNKIAKIDLSDGKRFWSRLESFYIGHNKLKEIPKEIGQLYSLRCFDISQNKDIRRLPEEMGDLNYLYTLNLQGLKNLSLDPNLVNGPTRAIINYLKSRHSRSVPYYRMKMMIVGAADKGKTTLLDHLIEPNSSSYSKPSNVATMGVSVKHWHYQHKQSEGSDVTYYINCWDFAGQEEFYSTHQCFLTQRSLYVLVYNFHNGESELKHLQPWLLNIQVRAPSSLIIIVGTHLDKCKLPHEELNKKRIELRMRIKNMLHDPGYPRDVDVSFSELNCFNAKQVHDLRIKVKGLIDSAKIRGQKIMGGLVPSNYIHFEELIEKEKKRLLRVKSKFPVLSESRLRKLMEESKLNLKMDKSEVQQAVKFLHECGVLLHYTDLQTKLSELYFLDPEWLCTLMAHIITFKHLSFVDDRGFMLTKSVPHILKEPTFPSEFIPEYIRLLERFEVVLRHTPKELLIPSQLPKKKPTEISLPMSFSDSQIIRRYVLCYVPPGFMPRLIARLMSFPQRSVLMTSEPSSLHVWSGGIYMYWSELSYCLLELLHKPESFDIKVPMTSEGVQLLCSIVDNVEALIDEWFPGLRDLNVVGGSELVKQMTLCPLCPAAVNPHWFYLKDLLKLVYTCDEVSCPVHKGTVKLEQLAPDIIIGDLESEYKLSRDDLSLDEIPQNVLGKGGFGDVYKAILKQQTVAVKVLSHNVASIANTTPNQLIRQEVQILSKLKHPYIISLVGVCIRPKAMLVLEYAELGSLSSMKPYSNINITLKHKIALQISSALAFLHKNRVIYRDLKPGNILIFSLSLLAKVNAKLSDYGIACFATAGGLTQSVGTPGYRAPELLMSGSSNMPYYDKVDVYSYGLMLFELMTNGHKPFEELSAGYEIDKFILEGRPINDIDHYGCPPWPDMQDLINHCLQYNPAQRPSAQEVFDRMCTSEFMALKRAITIERDHTVETFTIRVFMDDHHTRNTELWVVSKLGALSIFNLSKKFSAPRGMMLSSDTIYSMVAVDSSLVLMGSSTGVIFVYDGYDKELKYSLKSVQDSVLCLIHVKASQEGAYYVCAGLANGNLVFYDHAHLMMPNAKGETVNIGSGPVKSIKRYHSRLYATCGSDVVIVKISDLQVERRWTATDRVQGTALYLNNIEVGQNSIFTVQNKSSKLHIWDQDDGSSAGVLNCESIVNSMLSSSEALSGHNSRITSILLQQSQYCTMWIGFGSGHMLLLSVTSRKPLMVTKRHMHSIRCLQLVKAIMAEKTVNYVISGGFGFQQRPGYEAPIKGTPETYGSLLVWDSIMPRLKSNYDDIRNEMEIYR